MNQSEKSILFAQMHRKGQPLLLYNIWDAGSALAVVSTEKKTGATALATSSWAVAAAHGFEDGQLMPRDFMLAITQRIAACVTVPVTADFEGGYAVSPLDIEGSTAALLATGIAGLNFEDQVVGGAGLYSISTQVPRIAAVRAACLRASVPTFINARTDLFLQQVDNGQHAGLIEQAIASARAYQDAGADGFFVPGLKDKRLIGRLCAALEMPVNIMLDAPLTPIDLETGCNVARISVGPLGYQLACKDLANRFGACADDVLSLFPRP